jgi:hypothetical protein
MGDIEIEEVKGRAITTLREEAVLSEGGGGDVDLTNAMACSTMWMTLYANGGIN